MDLQSRVERLEHQNRRLKQLLIAVPLAVSALALMAAAYRQKPQTIEAEKVVIVDQQGKQRGAFGMEGGNPRLALCDADGKPLILLTNVEGRPALFMVDTKRQPRIELSVTKRGPVLNLLGEPTARVLLSGAGPSSTLEMFQEDGKRIFEVSKDKVQFYDADGNPKDLSRP